MGSHHPVFNAVGLGAHQMVTLLLRAPALPEIYQPGSVPLGAPHYPRRLPPLIPRIPFSIPILHSSCMQDQLEEVFEPKMLKTTAEDLLVFQGSSLNLSLFPFMPCYPQNLSPS